MAEGTRVQLVLPPGLADALRKRAAAERRSVSSLGSFLLETALRQLPPLEPPASEP